MAQVSLSDYVLGDILGVGTVGTIYEATEQETGRRVAIKILHEGASRDQLIRDRFRRERTILERLKHPNIIAYYGGGGEDDRLFYVMELVEGGSLKDLLAIKQRLDWKVVVEITRQLCSALQCAHNNGVIHRDLKPANLFFSREGDVKLGDFGIARDITKNDLTDTGLTVGTHAYMAPEQITGDNQISGKADLYALGCCVFEMLTGRKPFEAENFAEMFEQHLRRPPPRVASLVPGCPEKLDAIVDQLLSKSTEDRPFNARQVQAVMLQLAETQLVPEETEGDVPADQVADMIVEQGRRRLQQQISGAGSNDISWGQLVMLAFLLFCVITAAALFGRG